MPDPQLYPMTVTTGKTLGNRTGTWRAYRPQYVQHTPPCREACPAGEDIARWIDLLRAGDYRQAWAVLTEDNPFPATMGRICLHPCQETCNRGQHDGAVGINALEQFLGDFALAAGWSFPPPGPGRPGHVAVVGGGPAGLSCAYQLRRLGYRVTVYEAGAEVGGNLVRALPDFQLPLAVARAEIRRILDLGVEVHTGVRVGANLPWAEVQARHPAVFLAVGASCVPGPRVPGQDLAGVVDGLAFLQAVKQGRLALPGRRAVVLGAGLTGLEAARTLLRLGAAVTVVTAEAADSLPLPERVQEARAEDARLVTGAAVQAILGAGGAVAGVQLADQALPCDAVLLATGRAVDLADLPDEAEVDAALHVAADPFTGATRLPGLFAGGDATGTRSAAAAVGTGKQAAAAIHAYLQGQDPAAAMAPARLGYSPRVAMRYYLRPGSYPPQVQVRLQRVITYADIEPLYFDRRGGTERPWLPAAERTGSFAEARAGLTEAQARAEALRCFSCGTCIGCDNCLIFCPDMAIRRTPDGAAFTINWDACKGCGVCVQECPREALVLEEEIK